jgi:hypothetical protein
VRVPRSENGEISVGYRKSTLIHLPMRVAPVAAAPTMSTIATVVAVVAAMPSVVTALPVAIVPGIVSRTIVAIAGIIAGVVIISGRRRWGWGEINEDPHSLSWGSQGYDRQGAGGKEYFSFHKLILRFQACLSGCHSNGSTEVACLLDAR